MSTSSSSSRPEVVRIDLCSVSCEKHKLTRAGQLLRAGELVAFPTETVYGLGANALSDEAVAGIYQAKGRPSDNPLIVHTACAADALRLSETPNDPIAVKLAKTFWPGPLTMVLPVGKESGIAKRVTAGLDTVGLRVPSHPVAHAVIEAARVPIAAPSANTSGKPSPTMAFHVYEDMENNADAGRKEVPMIVDGGACDHGVESTVVRIMDSSHVAILRPGAVTLEQLRMCLEGMAEVDIPKPLQGDECPRAPGMKYRHYAPKAMVDLVYDKDEILREAALSDLDTVVIAFDDLNLSGPRIRSLGPRSDPSVACHRIFALFRECDDSLHASRVVVDARFDQTTGIGRALFNRIEKASHH
ncbi:hypothetical protein FOZ60_004695 [Perkinsus olseni]|uniref:Threonylcarbamoyl-AMP synthase n=1 Tax=Perkinsus olseni TaxID=32597 RepID=A0A7J6NSQ3_PEROL|nr:hypothetical protein FOZ60_004695 [Perkinsus olseni]